MQPIPILIPPSTKSFLGSIPFRPAHIFVIRTSCRGEATRMPWPLPHEMLNSECIPQTFFFACRIAPSTSARSYKMWISRVRAINEQVIHRASPARDQSTHEKWHSAKGVVTTRFPSSEGQTTLSPKHSSRPRYMLLAAIHHLKYLFRNKSWGINLAFSPTVLLIKGHFQIPSSCST